MAKQVSTWSIIICAVLITMGLSFPSHAQSPQKTLRLELQLAGIRLGSPVIDRDENGNLKPNCLLRVWGFPDLLITPAIQIRIRQINQEIRRLEFLLDALQKLRIQIQQRLIERSIVLSTLKSLISQLPPLLGEVIKMEEEELVSEVDFLRFIARLEKAIQRLLQIKQNELQEAQQIARVGSELIWTLMVNIPPAESLEGITQYVWIYRRGEAAMAFLEQDGIVIAIAVAGHDFPYARTALGDPFRSVKLGDDLQRVLLRYGPPDEIQFVGTPSIIQLIPISKGAIHNMMILRYHKTSNIEFLLLNNKVVRILIFLPEPEKLHSLKR